MKIRTQFLAIVLTALGSVMMIDAASAQATRTWVSGVGDDVNPCSRTAPCKTFAGAISKTAASGEINCLDPAGYGAVTITKSITISCKYTYGSVLASSTTGIIVNGANIEVGIRGLSINGGTPISPGVNGIRFLQGAALTVEDVDIRGFRGASPNGYGLIVNNTAGTAKLTVINSVIVNNGVGTAGSGGGIQIAPSGSGSAVVSIDNTQLINNTVGVRADASATTGAIDVTISRTMAARGAFHGFVTIGGATGRARMFLDGVVASSNGGEGVRLVGANAAVRIGRSTVNYNAVGVSITGGGNLRSYGDNFIDGNTDDGGLPVTSPQK
jgi:hypothetical protein